MRPHRTLRYRSSASQSKHIRTGLTMLSCVIIIKRVRPTPDQLHVVANASVVATASSDGTVKVWSPHSTATSEPSVIGTHNDYVRCLSYWCVKHNIL